MFDKLEHTITLEELKDLLEYMNEEDYGEVADILLDYIDDNYEDEDMLSFEIDECSRKDEDNDGDEDDEDEDEMDEKVSRVFGTKQKKRGLRHFSKTKSQLKKGKAKRKIDLKKGKVERKKYLRKNKAALKKKRKSYNAAIKKGQHKVKKRRG